METYHKINAPFKRHMEGPKKGRLIMDEWARPEFEYLAFNEWEFTEKVDGTNIRIGFGPYATTNRSAFPGRNLVVFAGRSDNAVIPPPLLEYLDKTFHTDLFLDNDLNGITLFGEGYGPKIQGGGKYTEDHSFVLFDVKIGDFWLDRDNVNDIASKLGIESVPVLGTGTIYDAIEIVSSGLTWDSNGRMKNWGGHSEVTGKNVAGLLSHWGPFEAEGIVARPVVPMFNRMGDRIILKIKGKDFK